MLVAGRCGKNLACTEKLLEGPDLLVKILSRISLHLSVLLRQQQAFLTVSVGCYLVRMLCPQLRSKQSRV